MSLRRENEIHLAGNGEKNRLHLQALRLPPKNLTGAEKLGGSPAVFKSPIAEG